MRSMAPFEVDQTFPVRLHGEVGRTTNSSALNSAGTGWVESVNGTCASLGSYRLGMAPSDGQRSHREGSPVGSGRGP